MVNAPKLRAGKYAPKVEYFKELRKDGWELIDQVERSYYFKRTRLP